MAARKQVAEPVVADIPRKRPHPANQRVQVVISRAQLSALLHAAHFTMTRGYGSANTFFRDLDNAEQVVKAALARV